MANTQGGSGEHPGHVNDAGPSRWFSYPTKRSDPAGYVDMADEDKPTERPIDEIPAGSRSADQGRPPRSRKSNLEVETLVAQRSKADLKTSDLHRTPSKRSSQYDVVDLTLSDDEEDERRRRHVPRRSETDNVSDEAKAVLSSTSEVYSTRQAERRGFSTSATPSFPQLHAASANSQTSSHSRIGGRADTGREQTTPQRVDANATSTTRREKDAGQPGTSRTSVRLPEGSQKIRDPSVSRIRIKPRAIKSALSPPTCRTDTHRRARDHAHSSSPAVVSKTNPEGQVSTAEHGLRSELANKSDIEPHPQHRHTGQNKVTKSLPVDVLHEASVEEDTDMGAQISRPEVPFAPAFVQDESENAPAGIRTPTPLACLSSSEVVQGQQEDMAQPPPLKNDPVSSVPIDFIEDIESARRRIEVPLNGRLNERFEDHAYLVKNAMWRQRTCYERALRSNAGSQQLQRHPMARKVRMQPTSPFMNMTDIQNPVKKGHENLGLHNVSQEVFTRANPKDAVIRSWSVKATTFAPEALQIPSFMEYISLRTNVLADNESKLLTMPLLGDDEPGTHQEALQKELPDRYEIKSDKNPYFDLRNEQYNFYFGTISSLLDDLGLSWDIMLYYMLSPDTELRRINRSSDKHEDYELLIQDRAAYDEETFQRGDLKKQQLILIHRAPEFESWQTLFSKLREPSSTQLRMAALTCAMIQANCNFSPWYLAKQSTAMREHIATKTTPAKLVPKSAFRSIVCRVCHGHNCLFHGQIREHPESDSPSEADSSSEAQSEEELLPAHVDSDGDSDIEKVVNYKIPSNPNSLKSRPTSKVRRQALPPSGPFKPSWWENNQRIKDWAKRKPFVPCNHEGSCVEARCRCFREKITCEKTCRCPSTCNRRFPGCKCTAGDRPCTTDKGCLCRKFGRECDADLCGSCGAIEILDPVNRHNDGLLHNRCKNVALQRGVSKKTLLGKSEVHGFGLYAGQDIHKEEVIGEYTGETISIGESGRRGTIYHYQKNMYLFRLNKDQEVDATHMGNKLRFINNAHMDYANCASKIVFCNTVFHVALYAITDIKAGSELFFDYRYPEYMTKNFKQPKALAIKEPVKAPNKGRKKRAPSSNDSLASDTGGYTDRWAKARAAKAAKARRKAMLAEKDLQTTTTGASGRLKQAWKSASGLNSSRMSKDSGADGRSARERDSRARQGSNTRSRVDTRATIRTPDFVVQDTDDEAEDTNGDAEAADPEVSEAKEDGSGQEDGSQGSDVPPGRAGPWRPRMVKSAPLVAVKSVKKKKGGARPGAGRKRKRPLVINSEDE